MLLGEPKSAICVQEFDDSQDSAIHMTYRILLRSSSIGEPRYPLLKVMSTILSWYNDDDDETILLFIREPTSRCFLPNDYRTVR